MKKVNKVRDEKEKVAIWGKKFPSFNFIFETTVYK